RNTDISLYTQGNVFRSEPSVPVPPDGRHRLRAVRLRQEAGALAAARRRARLDGLPVFRLDRRDEPRGRRGNPGRDVGHDPAGLLSARASVPERGFLCVHRLPSSVPVGEVTFRCLQPERSVSVRRVLIFMSTLSLMGSAPHAAQPPGPDWNATEAEAI